MAILHYNIHPRIETFTTGVNDTLPFYVLQPHQVHGDEIGIIDRRNMRREDLEGVDAVITNLDAIHIGVRTADCVPILLFDPYKEIIAAVHSGWRGTIKRIVNKTIVKMSGVYGTNPKDLLAVIGPSIGPESFFVHEEVKNAFLSAGFPMHEVCKKYNNEYFLIDLWRSNQWLLQQEGVSVNNIQIAGICTYLHHDEFYSARYENNNKCGRNINVIRIKSKCEV